jgi:hypothetical protein
LKKKPIRIVILQRGWVFIGRYTKLKGGERRIDDAHCIRVWGTSKGLGELVNGPKKESILDHTGTVYFHQLTEVASIKVEEAAWQSIFGS